MTLTADDLADLIRNACHEQHVTDIARSARVSRTTIYHWGQGRQLETVVRYLRVLEAAGLVIVVRRPAQPPTLRICNAKD